MPKYSMNICLHTVLAIEDIDGNRLLPRKQVVESLSLFVIYLLYLVVVLVNPLCLAKDFTHNLNFSFI